MTKREPKLPKNPKELEKESAERLAEERLAKKNKEDNIQWALLQQRAKAAKEMSLDLKRAEKKQAEKDFITQQNEALQVQLQQIQSLNQQKKETENRKKQEEQHGSSLEPIQKIMGEISAVEKRVAEKQKDVTHAQEDFVKSGVISVRVKAEYEETRVKHKDVINNLDKFQEGAPDAPARKQFEKEAAALNQLEARIKEQENIVQKSPADVSKLDNLKETYKAVQDSRQELNAIQESSAKALKNHMLKQIVLIREQKALAKEQSTLADLNLSLEQQKTPVDSVPPSEAVEKKRGCTLMNPLSDSIDSELDDTFKPQAR